jgi:septum site-determining protein MinC
MEQLIQIKGDRQGLRLFLSEEAPFETVLEALETQLRQGEGFFRGTDLMVDVGHRELNASEAEQLATLLETCGVDLRAIGTANRQSRGAIRDAGLRPVPSPTASPAAHTGTPPVAQPSSEALFVMRTIRSGQSVRHHGAITIVGDVNPGAEVVAGSNVVVWGRLRGVVHAGAIGDEEALVCALDLSPTQLRIASLAARAPEGSAAAGPEVAHIEKGRIVVEPWDIFRKG